MAAPVPPVPGKEDWGELIGTDINDALATIRQQRPDITEVCELDIHSNQLPPPLQEGVVRLVIYYDIVQDPNGVYVDDVQVCYPPPYIG